MAWFQDFALEFGKIDHESFVIEFFRMKANLKFPGMPVDIDTMPPVATDVVSEIDIYAFVYPVHRQTRLVGVDLKKQPENIGKANFLSINPPLARLSPQHGPAKS